MVATGDVRPESRRRQGYHHVQNLEFEGRARGDRISGWHCAAGPTPQGCEGEVMNKLSRILAHRGFDLQINFTIKVSDGKVLYQDAQLGS